MRQGDGKVASRTEKRWKKKRTSYGKAKQIALKENYPYDNVRTGANEGLRTACLMEGGEQTKNLI